MNQAIQPGDNIRTITASMWLHVTDNPLCTLEGPAFDRKGDLYFVDVEGMGKVYKASLPSRELSVIYNDRSTPYAAVKIHQDGRLFLCGFSAGTIDIITADGVLLKTIETTGRGNRSVPDDMIFDGGGNFLFTSYDSQSSTGGLYRVSSDLARLDLVAELDHANGVSLSPDGRHVWVSETHKRIVRCYDLDGEGNVTGEAKSSPFQIPEHIFGFPDSNQVDSAGNLYQALYIGARLIVISEHGEHVADVMLPEEDWFGYSRTTNVAFQPGTDTGFITTAGDAGGRIYTFKGMAPGHPLYSHS